MRFVSNINYKFECVRILLFKLNFNQKYIYIYNRPTTSATVLTRRHQIMRAHFIVLFSVVIIGLLMTYFCMLFIRWGMDAICIVHAVRFVGGRISMWHVEINLCSSLLLVVSLMWQFLLILEWGAGCIDVPCCSASVSIHRRCSLQALALVSAGIVNFKNLGR